MEMVMARKPMKTRRRAWIRFALVAAALTMPLGAMADVVVIVNAANTAAVDDDTIANIFLGQTKTFPGGAEASPVDQKEGAAAREAFGAKFLKKNPAQLRAFWARQIFTGGAKPIRQLEDDDAVVKFVA